MPTYDFYIGVYKKYIKSFYITNIDMKMVACYYGITTRRMDAWVKNIELSDYDIRRIKSIYSIAISMHKNGHSIDEISNELIVHYNIIYYWINNRYCDVIKDAPNDFRFDLSYIAKTEYKVQLGSNDISKKYEVCQCKVWEAAKCLGIVKPAIITEEEKIEIVRLYHEGYNVSEIKLIVDRAISKVSDILEERVDEYVKQIHRNPFSKDEKELVIKLYLGDGLTPTKISTITGFKLNSVKRLISESGKQRSRVFGQIGSRGSNYIDGSSKYPYCEKFDRGLKERVISYFDYKCVLCGIHEDLNKRRLSVHHVNDNPTACCDKSPRVFVPLCNACHAMVRSKKNLNFAHRKRLNKIVKENNLHEKTYYTYDEYVKKFNRCPYEYYLERQRYMSKLKLAT